MTEKVHKAGFVNILGNPNVGKSTLMNALVGEKLSIITSKAQTTRHRIMGIVNGEDFQIVYSDTPGILAPKYRLQESMLRFVDTAFTDADVILYVTDVKEKADKHQKYIDKITKSPVPILVLLNKIDLSNQQEVETLVGGWHEILPLAQVIPVSAIEKFNLEPVLGKVLELLPESPPYFPKDELTDKTERFFVSEIIREKIFLNYQKEIPYSVEVEVESFKDEANIVKIAAVIYVARETQKGIIIGRGGTMLKKVGTEARKDTEGFLGKKVFLEIFVKVKKDWRDSDYQLKRFGYQ
ncbi:MAG: GTPase Era [Bacteroidales bacterium]|nr:GTPase Era [Bacteroidales bacterium]